MQITQLRDWLGSSIGKKQIVGLTGLGIGFFALTHMSGNLLMIISPRAYNLYGHGIVSNPVFPLLEIGLAGAFIVHILFAIGISLENKKARPQKNVSPGTGPKRATFASRSMIQTGMLILVFLILHLITFKFGPHYTVTYDGLEVRDLYRLVNEKFHEPGYVAWYLFSLLVLGVHLSHGLSSAFQSLGILGARTPWLRKTAWAFALVVAGGFISQPLWILCCGGN